ncbi:transcription initiation factor TFIID subunit 4 isoform X3 [Agrilus planipennis]|uniref:Transcription initiation factor TFIID subunit 4 isoform X3 n=1 Tax=Agrilus planipennis TaxID=224129 RepID=A0A1W4X8M4_AGRPL|nr:transcription initiation factor TFIID subunit 4 isoform X3 [Agrilus planipennis]
MASAKFLEEALRSDVDESAVNAIVGSLENQLVTSTPAVSIQSNTSIGINQNHINSAISNGGTVPSQKHGAIINGESIVSSATTADTNKLVVNNALSGTIITGAAAQVATGAVTTSYVNQVNNNNHNNNSSNSQTSKANDTGGGGGGVKVVFSQSGQTMTSAAAVLSNRVATFPTSQTIPNGTIGLSSLTPQTVLQTTTTNVQTIQAKQPTIVIKTSGAPAGSPGLVTLPMNVSPVPQVNNQLTLQSLHGLQPGQQGHLLLKTENGQYQLLRVGPAPGVATGLPASSVPGATTPVTFRMQAVPAVSRLNIQFTPGPTIATIAPQKTIVQQGATAAPVSSPAPASGVTTVNNSAVPTVVQTATPVQRPANDNTKEKCRKFLANLLELSSREPKSVERSVRTLIQELIDMHVEPEDFCDRLERLLNASPQPCLIGFLKKSLPLLRHSLATKELSIDGIRPPPANVVFSIQSGTAAVATVSTQVRPAAVASSQVRLVAPGATVVRPAGAGHVVQQRLVTPVRGAVQQTTRMVATIRQPNSVATPVAVSSSQPPALHPVFPATNQVRATGATVVRQQPVQVRTPVAVRTAATPVQVKGTGASGTQAASQKSLGVSSGKPSVPSSTSKSSKDKDKKASFSASAAAAAYAGNVAGDDDINDVAAMGGVNLAEETQKILGSTEFVGTQIRSCKEDVLLNMGPLQQKLRQVMQKHGLDEPSNEVVACVSHAVQERLKNLIEKLSIITEHRLEMVKTDQRYEVTSDIKGQLKFLEDLDRAERKRHEELEREMLLRAAKSRSKTEDPEQAKLKAKAKEMQRVEMEELRQREANATALQAIGPRKKPRLDGDASAGSSQTSTGSFHSGARGQLPLRARMKKVTLRDLQFLFETEKDLCKSPLLYKSYLK